MELGLGEFEFKNRKLVKSEKVNLYEFTKRYSARELESAGFVYNDPRSMGGWELPTSRVDKVVQIRRPMSEDIALYQYISENMDDVPYHGLELKKTIDLC